MSNVSAALALAARGFHVFPLKVRGKTPAHTGWQEEATRDAAKIRAMFSHAAYNVGIFTSRFWDDQALLVVDVDNKNGKDGDSELLRLEIEGDFLADTYTQFTPTGGRHLVFCVDEPVKQGANVLAPGLDVRSSGGYIVGAGSVLEIGAYTANDVDVVAAPQWAVDVCGRPAARREANAAGEAAAANINQERANRRAIDYLLNEAPASVEGQGGDQTAYMVACRVKDFGVSRDDCFALMLDHWNDRCAPPWDDEDLLEKVGNAYSYGNEPVGAAAPEADFPPLAADDLAGGDEPKGHPFDELNREYAFVTVGNSGAILHETTDADGNFCLKYLEVATFHTKLAARKMRIETKNRSEEVAVTKLWIQDTSRRTYEGVVFRPGLPTPKGYYNMWRGFTVQPKDGDHPALDMFLEHALVNVCRGDNDLFRWLIGYFAQMIQRPWEKPLVALVFKGEKGTGKNALVERVGHLLGTHFTVADDDRYLLSNFNGHMEKMLFMVLDEAAWAGDKRAEGKLKGIVTGSHHLIEHKGKEPYRVENRTRIAIIGNDDWLVPASHDERRFAVFEVGNGRKQDRAFFQAMREGMEAGGYAHLLAYLLSFDLAGLDLNGAPATGGLLHQKTATLEPLEQWWLDCLTDGHITSSDFGQEWPEVIECERLRAAFGRYLKDRNIRTRAPDSRSVGRSLNKMLGEVKRNRGPASAGQPWRYVLPTLEEARARWEKFIGHRVEWEAE